MAKVSSTPYTPIIADTKKLLEALEKAEKESTENQVKEETKTKENARNSDEIRRWINQNW